MIFKETVYKTCKDLLDARIAELKEVLHDLTAGAAGEVKSSAGDKHETSRAMMQLEHEKISHQLRDAELQKDSLEKTSINTRHSTCRKGSLVKTDKGYLFMSIPLGKVKVDNIDVIVLSPASPLGIALTGHKENETVETNGVKYVIQSIL